MDRHLAEWKFALDRLSQESAPDWREIARIVSAIATTAQATGLPQAASQALPSVRNAAANPADHMTIVVARRRLAIVRDVLHVLVTPKFGRRSAEPEIRTPEERCREMLGLPLGRQLAAAEIHQAFRRTAKRAHPDGGGSEHAFLALAAARDALMRPASKKGG